MLTPPALINGVSHTDSRGTLLGFNQLDLKATKRMYIVENRDTSLIRAWQAHKLEQKWFFVFSGSFKMVLVKMDNFENPGNDLPYSEYILDSADNKILYVPGGYANGFQAIENGSKLLVFSDLSIDQAKADQYRFDSILWYNWGVSESK